MYRIKSVSKLTGHTNFGKWQNDFNRLKKMVDQLNIEVPEMAHIVEKMGKNSPGKEV